jgi:death-on-curing protein
VRRKPKWLRLDVVLAMQGQLLAEHGGSAGLRDEKLLDSALARPPNLFAYGKPSIFDLAAAYACGIMRSHPFVDGNKRTGFMAAFVFLEANRVEFRAGEADVAVKTLAAAAGEMTEEDYAAWLRENSRSEDRTA